MELSKLLQAEEEAHPNKRLVSATVVVTEENINIFGTWAEDDYDHTDITHEHLSLRAENLELAKEIYRKHGQLRSLEKQKEAVKEAIEILRGKPIQQKGDN